MNKENKILPSGWKEVCLGDVCDISRGGSPRPIEQFITNSSNGLPWLRIGDVDKNGKYITSTNEKIIPKGLKKTTLVHPGEFILSNSMSFGRPYISKIDVCIHDGWLALRNLTANINTEFLYYLLLSYNSQKAFQNNAAGSGVRNLKSESVQKIKILIPSLKEQEKIAEVLSSADSVIELTVSKISKLKLQKKSLMQKLLTPKPHWIEKQLGDIVNFLKGKGLPKSDIKEDGAYDCIHYGELFTKYNEDIYVVYSKTNSNNKTILSKKNDVLMPTSDVTPRGLGTASCIHLDNVILGGDILIIRPKDVLLGSFLSYYVSFKPNEIVRLANGTTVFHIYASSLKLLKLNLPPLKEQEEIAEVLKTQDAVISLNEQKLQNLKLQKKSLMQKLLTGEWRV